MRAFGHVSISLLAVKLLVWYVSVPQLVFAAVFALLPDLDHPGSILSKLCPKLSRNLFAIFGHRTFTHSLYFALIITNFFAFNLDTYIVAVISIASHLIADMLTYMGVPLLWPYQKNFVVFGGPLKTGSWQEIIISIISIAFFIFLYL